MAILGLLLIKYPVILCWLCYTKLLYSYLIDQRKRSSPFVTILASLFVREAGSLAGLVEDKFEQISYLVYTW